MFKRIVWATDGSEQADQALAVAKSLASEGAAALMIVVAVKSTEAMLFNWIQRLQTLPFSASVFFMPVPIGTGLSAIYLVIMLLTDRKVLIASKAEPEG